MKISFTYISRFALVYLVSFLCFSISRAQEKDTTKPEKKKNNIFDFAVNAITRSTPDSTTELINAKSEKPYLPYEGKIIRHIRVRTFGFETTFQDTTQSSNYFGTRILNHLHRNSREWVIRNNLFVKERTPVNAYMMADNERYLRSLEFMQDARILIRPIENNPDSVDVEVATKDLFSIVGEVTQFSPEQFKGRIADANVLGMGQKVQLSVLWDQLRTPTFGYNLLYSKNNIANSFVNASVAYGTINPNLQGAAWNEQGWMVRFDRPLASQYLHVAGSAAVLQGESFNLYNISDTLFYKYKYRTYDAWIGYNIGVRKYLHNINVKGRQFVAIRFLNTNFLESPEQVKGQLIQKFNTTKAVLGSFTLFRQNFFKTNYLYGFGTTEDVPYGYNVAFTGGWYQQSFLNRGYAGVDANRYIVTKKKDIIQYFGRACTFINQGELQDASVMLGGSMFSRLFVRDNVKLRQYMRLTYAQQFSRMGIDPLSLSNTFGIRYFSSDSTLGDQRLSLHSETYLFLKYKVFGFKFAPFVFGDAAVITPENEKFAKSGVFYGLGGGVRTRNENLVFGTMELRFIFFPRKAEMADSFKLEFTTNLNFRYNSSYVKAPDIIQLNNDPNNSVF
ncbi:hypothetical protein QTN47_05745 [Danxiaibacter flavus]|uniref:Outer membrane protein/protective antigen OMA87 n=1 Tax=Danxiaibacter flavus TaxID=3049108 RepID=A0ABV3ZBW8_9BACT|nr:hypothetical protein QNM32_05745 [Chitinophagaceae bacterium DXS]